MNRALRTLVWRRARHSCEYCGMRQKYLPLAVFHVEHIVPRQHRGQDEPANLCLSCDRCNFSKGPNLTGIDPDTGQVVRLFHPRRQSWRRHFRWDGPYLLGLTKTGRATIAVLDINNSERVNLRAHLIAYGMFPG